MRVTIPVLLVLILITPLAAGAAGHGPEDLRVSILSVRMADPHALAVEVATSGLQSQDGQPPVVDLRVWLDGVPARAALPLIDMPPRFTMVLDLPAGVITVGGIPIGAFHPVLPFTENLRFPVDVTVRHGSRAATARSIATILLPTVIVPGYLNELSGQDETVLTRFRRHGYATGGAAPSLFWFTYSSRRLTLEEAGRALAAYVRQTVLPAGYAARINVVGYSVGGLIARWTIAHNLDGWGTLVNRLVLIGVPNEGSVMAYMAEHAPSFLPFSGLGQSPLAESVVPVFPFWRAGAGQPWSLPPDAHNPVLTDLNARPIPPGIRVYVFFGNHDPRDSAGPQTAAGVTRPLPGGALSFASGDGVVLAASAQGLPIHGGTGVPVLSDRTVARVDLGTVYHMGLLAAGADRIAAALLDRFRTTVDEAPAARSIHGP
jgi:hypothetical protein